MIRRSRLTSRRGKLGLAVAPSRPYYFNDLFNVDGLTLPAIGDTYGVRMCPDNEGIYHYLRPEEWGQWGSRRVENLLEASEDFSGSSWVKQGTASVTGTNVLNFVTTGDNVYRKINTPIRTGDVYTGRVVLSGSGTVNLRVQRAGGGVGESTALTVTLTSAPTIYSVVHTFTNNQTDVRFDIYRAGSNTVTQVTANFAMLENKTGSSQPNIPSEYVSSGVATGEELAESDNYGVPDGHDNILSGVTDSEFNTNAGTTTSRVYLDIPTLAGATYVFSSNQLSANSLVTLFVRNGSEGAGDIITSATDVSATIVFKALGTDTNILWSTADLGSTFSYDNISVRRIDHGANVDSVRYYQTLLANTVDVNGVVTESVGAPITLDNSALEPQGMLFEGEATEISGVSGALDEWTSTTTASVAQDAVGLDGKLSAWTVTDSDVGSSQLRQKNTGISSGMAKFTFATLVKYDASPLVYPCLYAILPLSSSKQQAIVFNPSDGSYNTAHGNGDVTSVSRLGSWWLVIQSITSAVSGDTRLDRRIYPAYNTDGSATQDVTAQGSTVIAYAGLFKDTYSFTPIPTSGGVPATRPANVGVGLTDFDWNIVDPEGSLQIECMALFSETTGVDEGILTPRSTNKSIGIFCHSFISGRVVFKDGVTSAPTDNVYSTLSPIRIRLRWGTLAGTMSFSVLKEDGTLLSSDVVAYAGSFNPNGLPTLAKGLTQGMTIKNIKSYKIDKGAVWQSAAMLLVATSLISSTPMQYFTGA